MKKTHLRGALPQPGRSVLVTVNNWDEVIKKQGGGVGGIANMLVPDTVQTAAYGKLATKLADGLKSEGVDAKVQVVAQKDYAPAGSSPLWKPLAIGALGVLGFFGVRRLVRRRK